MVSYSKLELFSLKRMNGELLRVPAGFYSGVTRGREGEKSDRKRSSFKRDYRIIKYETQLGSEKDAVRPVLTRFLVLASACVSPCYNNSAYVIH